MKNYRNNQKRHRFRNNGDRNFKRNGNLNKLNNDFNNVSEFKRKNPGKNNQNATKLIEKYTELAREALSNGDKILSENYLQHADHFTRILNEKESLRKEKFQDNRSEVNSEIEQNIENSEKKIQDTSSDENKIEKDEKSQIEMI